MMGLLITLLIAILIFGCVVWIVSMIPMPQPMKNIAMAVLAVVMLIFLIAVLTGYTPWWRGWR